MDKKPDNIPENGNPPLAEVSGKNDGLAKNPNPRANENIDTSDADSERTTGPGTEITDGEAG